MGLSIERDMYFRAYRLSEIKKLLKQNVKIYIITRDPKEHYVNMKVQSTENIIVAKIDSIRLSKKKRKIYGSLFHTQNSKI